jgi:hypothetical protein
MHFPQGGDPPLPVDVGRGTTLIEHVFDWTGFTRARSDRAAASPPPPPWSQIHPRTFGPDSPAQIHPRTYGPGCVGWVATIEHAFDADLHCQW